MGSYNILNYFSFFLNKEISEEIKWDDFEIDSLII